MPHFLFIVDPIDGEPFTEFEGDLEPSDVVSMFVRIFAKMADAAPGWVLIVRQLGSTGPGPT